METKNERNFDPKNEEDREQNYTGNEGAQMPDEETDPGSIRNPEEDESGDPSEKNAQRPTPGTL